MPRRKRNNGGRDIIGRLNFKKPNKVVLKYFHQPVKFSVRKICHFEQNISYSHSIVAGGLFVMS